MHGWITDVSAVAKSPNNTPEDLLWLFFAPTETSRQCGKEFLARFASRKERDLPNGPDVANAPRVAADYRVPCETWERPWSNSRRSAWASLDSTDRGSAHACLRGAKQS